MSNLTYFKPSKNNNNNLQNSNEIYEAQNLLHSLNCLSKCICSECVIHGIHKNHDVINIKKAYPLVYGKIEELCSNINDKVKNIKKLNDNIEKKIFKI